MLRALRIAGRRCRSLAFARPDNVCEFEGLRSRHGQAEAILVAYDIMQHDGRDVRFEPLEERRKRLAKLLSRNTKAMGDASN